ncbi:hypothetical protein TNCT_577242 [Trichonephila clavata]|uniref:Uncharacterized protein n=1 Tax=Trichonephila clavata TaxID=2740835 RepID=A0A8X6I714_TRICU|nr:hypothetical protein TNCT_577242 [Trichonephila clavata]
MNSAQCVSKVLERIVENMDSFSQTENITHLVDSVSKIGSYALKKSLPCSLLRNVIMVLNKFQLDCNSHLASTFLNEVYQFYKTENLCINFKLALLSCLRPAVETEILQLLNRCNDVHHADDLSLVKSTVLESCLPMACIENPSVLHKVNCILKESLIITNEKNFQILDEFIRQFKIMEPPQKILKIDDNELKHWKWNIEF